MGVKFTNFLKLVGGPEGRAPSEAMDAALAAVAQMHADGYALVPTEATDAMVAAAATVADLSPEKLREIWRTMLAAW